MRVCWLLVRACWLVLLIAAVSRADEKLPHWQFRLSFPKEVRAEPFSGRVVLYFSQTRPQPRERLSWFKPEILVGRDVIDWKPGESLIIDSHKPDETTTCPQPVDQLNLAGWKVQAVARFNSWERKVGDGAGNGFSPVSVVPSAAGTIDLPITQLIPERPFPENDWCKLLRVRSERLSEFHKREVFLQAAVLLPASYHKQPDRKYPVIFTIPGFGGTHFEGVRTEPINEQNEGGVEFIRLMLDPSCPLGHHVFADSANNGPFGTALVTELIPELDKRFRTDARPQARFLTGHSSGGWSSLWLMVSHPDDFAGTWSTSPDPVTFENFQNINLFATGENMYSDRAGNRRPIARRGQQVVLWYRDFDVMEEALGTGGQLHSFEAAFSPRGPDGKPIRVWDRQTGIVNTEATKGWEAYDIRRVLERNWPTLGPKLSGKLHIVMGDADTFYLEGATRLLGESLKKLNSDAVVEMLPGQDHGSLLTPQLMGRLRAEMVAKYLSAK
ncbi:MAG: alpha/beta hydrolase [Planctomycetaceae bacterium]